MRTPGKGVGDTVEQFEYVAWIDDSRLPASDVAAEWPVMFIVSAPFADAAQDWGDALAKTRFPPGGIQSFSWSLVVPVVESTTPGLEELAVVACGDLAADSEIGW